MSDAREAEDARLTRVANLLGALSLMVTDRTSDAIAEAAGQSETAAAALSALHHFLDRPTIDLLRRVLGLTSSGTVRLVDRLEQAGYVERMPGSGDGRSTVVALTASGRRAAEQVAAARARVLEDSLADLSQSERETLETLAGRMLVSMIRGPGAVRWMCRMCDTHVCRGEPGGCPVTNATRARFSPADTSP